MTTLDFTLVKNIRNFIIPWTLADGAATHFTRYITIPNLSFQPDIAIIRSVQYNSNNEVASPNIYIIESDLDSWNGAIASFPDNTGTTNAPGTSDQTSPCSPVIININTIIKIQKPINSIQLNLYQIGNGSTTYNTKVPVSTILYTDTAVLTLAIDFIELHKA